MSGFVDFKLGSIDYSLIHGTIDLNEVHIEIMGQPNPITIESIKLVGSDFSSSKNLFSNHFDLSKSIPHGLTVKHLRFDVDTMQNSPVGAFSPQGDTHVQGLKALGYQTLDLSFHMEMYADSKAEQVHFELHHQQKDMFEAMIKASLDHQGIPVEQLQNPASAQQTKLAQAVIAFEDHSIINRLIKAQALELGTSEAKVKAMMLDSLREMMAQHGLNSELWMKHAQAVLNSQEAIGIHVNPNQPISATTLNHLEVFEPKAIEKMLNVNVKTGPAIDNVIDQ